MGKLGKKCKISVCISPNKCKEHDCTCSGKYNRAGACVCPSPCPKIRGARVTERSIAGRQPRIASRPRRRFFGRSIPTYGGRGFVGFIGVYDFFPHRPVSLVPQESLSYNGFNAKLGLLGKEAYNDWEKFNGVGGYTAPGGIATAETLDVIPLPDEPTVTEPLVVNGEVPTVLSQVDPTITGATPYIAPGAIPIPVNGEPIIGQPVNGNGNGNGIDIDIDIDEAPDYITPIDPFFGGVGGGGGGVAPKKAAPKKKGLGLWLIIGGIVVAYFVFGGKKVKFS